MVNWIVIAEWPTALLQHLTTLSSTGLAYLAPVSEH